MYVPTYPHKPKLSLTRSLWSRLGETRDVGAGLVVRFRRRRFVGCGIDEGVSRPARSWYQPGRMSSGWLVGRVWREGHPCSRCSLASIMEPPSFLGSLSPNKSPRFGLCLRIEQKIGHYLAISRPEPPDGSKLLGDLSVSIRPPRFIRLSPNIWPTIFLLAFIVLPVLPRPSKRFSSKSYRVWLEWILDFNPNSTLHAYLVFCDLNLGWVVRRLFKRIILVYIASFSNDETRYPFNDGTNRAKDNRYRVAIKKKRYTRVLSLES